MLFLLLILGLAGLGHGRTLDKPGLELTIVHVNDIHAHFEEMNEYGARCNAEESKADKCYGGQARLLTKAKELMALDPDKTLFLNAGDYYTGSVMFSKFGYPAIVDFSNMMGYHAMSIGNHDFDKEISGLVPFIQGANYSMLAANLNHSNVPDLDGCKNSKVFLVDGYKVGVIGYITTTTPDISAVDLTSVDFTPEIPAVQKEAKMLKETQDVDIIIALGHSGYDTDMALARSVPEIDVVVGGHSHTFLWTGDNPPAQEIPKGPYPTYITQESGKVVPVVQAFCYSKYIGYFKLKFDSQGELLTPVDGKGVTDAQPYLINRQISPDQAVLDKIAKYRKNMTEYDEEVGDTEVLLRLEGLREGNLGNLVTEGMLEAFDPPADIALTNNGGLRASIAPGKVIYEDVINVLPFENTINKGKILGSDLRKILEEKYSRLCANQTCFAPTFFQMAGLRVKVLVQDGNEMHRITEMNVRCQKETWCEFDDGKYYWIALPSFLANGGAVSAGKMGAIRDTKFNDVLKDVEVGPVDADVMKNHIRKHSPIRTECDGRIDIEYQKTSGSSSLQSFLIIPLATMLFRL